MCKHRHAEGIKISRMIYFVLHFSLNNGVSFFCRNIIAAALLIMVCALTVHVIRVVRKLTRAFFKKLPVGGGGVHKGPFGYDRRDQKIVRYADIVSIFITE